MTITAELADGRRLEFPDGTDPGVVQATVKKLLSPQGTQTEGWTPFTPSGELTGGVADVTTAEAIMGNPVTQFAIGAAEPVLRSEEHTSELQSQSHLVC